MILIGNLCPNLQTVKMFAKPISKRRCFRTRFESQHVKVSQILPKYSWEHFYHVFSSFPGKLIWKMSPLVLGEIIGVFVNTLTADGKYPVQHCENLQFQIQMQLSEKEKLFLNFLFHSWNLHQILNTLKKKMLVTADVFPKVQDMKILVRPLSKKPCLRTPFDSQHEKASQVLAKSQ